MCGLLNKFHCDVHLRHLLRVLNKFHCDIHLRHLLRVLNKFHCDVHLRHLLRVQKFFYALIAFWRIKKYCMLFIISPFTLCSASFRLLLLKFDIRELRPRLIHWSLKYQGVELRNLQDVSCRPRFEFGMTFPTLRLTPERWMDSRVESTVGCFP